MTRRERGGLGYGGVFSFAIVSSVLKRDLATAPFASPVVARRVRRSPEDFRLGYVALRLQLPPRRCGRRSRPKEFARGPPPHGGPRAFGFLNLSQSADAILPVALRRSGRCCV